MISLLAAMLMLMGSLIMLLAAIGLLKLDDVWLRMHAASKSPSLGMVLMVLGAGNRAVGDLKDAVDRFTHLLDNM